MSNKKECGMFCFQCEQTAQGKGCTGGGVCGKRADTALLQDRLVQTLIGISLAATPTSINPQMNDLMIRGLFATLTNVNFDNASLTELLNRALETQKSLGAPEYDLQTLWTEKNEDIRSLKSCILFGLKGMAAYAFHAAALGYTDEDVNDFFYKGLKAVGQGTDADALRAMVMETGNVNLKCMGVLDKANTETYGDPEPTQVTTNIEKGPFIVVTGHDLHDLYLLLQQTAGKGINIYTHGEMLPAHGYPKLKQFPHLKGNFGTAWQNQQTEFDSIPGTVLFTTNCLMPVRSSYADRVFTTGVVGFPGLPHIGADKDFTPVIDKALALGGYSEEKHMTGINGGDALTTGCARNAVQGQLDKIVESIRTGNIRHIFLVGGCDGAKPGRNYYTEFVRQTPPDTLVLTLACGKYRFNDMTLGEINGIPRLLDMGQCNDAYSAVKVLSALAGAFGTDVNRLPASLILSWYEQKAVCILLTLFALNIRNIYLGPTPPAFFSPNITDFLVKTFDLKRISTPEADLKEALEHGQKPV